MFSPYRPEFRRGKGPIVAKRDIVKARMQRGWRLALLMVASLAACRAAPLETRPRAKAPAPVPGDYSTASQARLGASMSGPMLAIARRLDGGRRSDLASRAPGWAVLDVATPPTLGFGALSPEEAERINAFLPAASAAPPPVPPFFLNVAGPERDRAMLWGIVQVARPRRGSRLRDPAARGGTRPTARSARRR